MGCEYVLSKNESIVSLVVNMSSSEQCVVNQCLVSDQNVTIKFSRSETVFDGKRARLNQFVLKVLLPKNLN